MSKNAIFNGMLLARMCNNAMSELSSPNGSSHSRMYRNRYPTVSPSKPNGSSNGHVYKNRSPTRSPIFHGRIGLSAMVLANTEVSPCLLARDPGDRSFVPTHFARIGGHLTTLKTRNTTRVTWCCGSWRWCLCWCRRRCQYRAWCAHCTCC